MPSQCHAMIPRIRFLLLLLVEFGAVFSVNGQSLPHLPGQLLVSLRSGTTPEGLAQRGSASLGIPVVVQKKVATLLNIWQLQTTGEASAEWAALDWLRHQPEVQAAQLNHLLGNRSTSLEQDFPSTYFPASTAAANSLFPSFESTTGPHGTNNIFPNDPLIGAQWQYMNTGSNGGIFDADLDAEQAWDFTTGGVSAAGDTIVVAVIDGGADFQHPDLAPNAWHNWADVPNDGLDNDQNGFIDDFRGWNVDAQNDDITGQTMGHGTPVCGLIGARGNNNMGVAGVNWQVKLLFVASSGTEASILAAYDYVLAARRLYNSTNGQHGAFITALNCSWGINYGQPADAPLWCAAFDTLGAAGILSIAATANLALDVDLTGDLPTACPSDYLITVTSLRRNDQKALLAGWGAKTIDLGAYGQGVFTLGEGNTYGNFSGTSYAAPQVAGAIGLLYSMPCPSLIAMAKNDPAAAARWAKELLLQSTTPNFSLAGATSSGGRLNLFNLLHDYQSSCNTCPAPFSLNAGVQDSSIVITWAQIVGYQYFDIKYRRLGQLEWTIQEHISSPFVLPVPMDCQVYEFSLQAYCVAGQTSVWAEAANFATSGCCAPSSIILLQEATPYSLTLTWNGPTAWNNGVLRYRPVGSTFGWLTMEVSGNSATLDGLQECTNYEIQVYGQCDSLLSPLSPLFQFATSGCDACTDFAYCTANAGQASGEWIAAVSINDWSQASGNGGGGYQNFTVQQAATIELHPLTTPTVAVTPGFFGLPNKEYFRIYVDFNADGDFTDINELAFDPGYAHDGTITGSLKVPSFTNAGYTRMRVMMKAKNATNQPPAPCESFNFGQVEDYCVLLSPSSASPEILTELPGTLQIAPQPARTAVWLEWPTGPGKNIRLQVWNMTGQLIVNQSIENSSSYMLDVNNWESGIYIVSIQTEKNSWQAQMLKW